MERKIIKIAPNALLEAELRIKRVAAYARVSSGKEAMLHSLAAQISAYSSMIQKTPGWEYAGVYADEATTGTKDSRAEFQRLLEDCRAGKIDMIVTKSVSRFARNVLTTLQVIRELRALNVDVYFEEQNIHTLGGDGEFLLTVLALYAQEEARSASENQKWRIQKNFENLQPWSVTMFGYRLVNGRLEVEPVEAEFLRLAADLYLEGMGGLSLARVFRNAEVPTRQGGQWREYICYMLFNEKVAGDLLLQKTYINDPLEKKKCINDGKLPQIHIKDNHEPIIDRATFEAIQKERQRRADKYRPPQSRGKQKTYPFSGKIVCGNCGAHYRRKTANAGTKYQKAVWFCLTMDKHGKAACASKQIPEAVLEEKTAQALGATKYSPELVGAVNEIRVPQYGTLIFVLKDGSSVAQTWEHSSRRDTWDTAKREQARQKRLLNITAERGRE